MALIDSLLNLYRVDTQVRSLRSRLESAQRYLDAQNKQIEHINRQRDELATRKKQLQASAGNREAEIAGIDERIEKLRDELNNAVTNKQYNALLNELNGMKTERAKVEEAVLGEMEQIEGFDGELAELDSQLQERQKLKEVAENQLKDREADVGQRLAELQQEREQAAVGIPEEVLQLFDELGDANDGEAAIIMLDDYVDTVRLTGFWQQVFLGREHPPRGVVLFVMMLLVAPLAAIEMSRIFQASGIATRKWLTAAAAILGLVLSYSIPMGTPAVTATALLATGLIVVFVAGLITFSRHQNVQGVLAAAGAVVFAMVYLGLMLGFLLALRREHSAWWIVGIIVTTKACDIGAYFTGTLIGRHKMIPWLSPGKTWEGLAGGIVLSVLVGAGLAAMSGWLPESRDHVPVLLGAVCGAVFAVVGQFGDLTMSLFKRGAGLKDSSRLLPGMGGVLDVLDSPLMVAPVAYWLLMLALAG